MVIRVVLAAAIFATAIPAGAQETLSYEIDNFFYTQPPAVQSPVNILPDPPAIEPRITRPAPPSDTSPPTRIAYDLADLLFDRTPDHFALAYRLEGLTDYTPQYRDGRDIDPLRYEIEGLLYNIYARMSDGDRTGSAASP